MVPAVDNQIGVFLTIESVFPGEHADIELLRSLLRELNKSDTIVILPAPEFDCLGPLE